MGDLRFYNMYSLDYRSIQKLSSIIETYPETMGDDMKMIDEYTQALMRFDDKGFYQIEEQIERELDNFQQRRGT